MSIARHHAEWLSLVETSGPFLSMPVLMRVFPQGLDRRDPVKASKLREKYEDWLERGTKQFAVHQAWVRHVLTDTLEYPPEFLAALKKNKAAQKVYDNFSPSAKRDYIEWFTEAKREATRVSRIEQAIEWIAEGKQRHWKYQNC